MGLELDPSLARIEDDLLSDGGLAGLSGNLQHRPDASQLRPLHALYAVHVPALLRIINVNVPVVKIDGLVLVHAELIQCLAGLNHLSIVLLVIESGNLPVLRKAYLVERRLQGVLVREDKCALRRLLPVPAHSCAQHTIALGRDVSQERHRAFCRLLHGVKGSPFVRQVIRVTVSQIGHILTNLSGSVQNHDSVSFSRQLLHALSGQTVDLLLQLRVLFLRHLVDLMDGGAGQNVMELVDQGLLPHVIQLLHGICQLVLGQHRQQLQIHESQLRLAVGALVASHGGKGSPMVLEIQLTLPDRKPPIVLHSFLQFVKIGSGKLLPYRGNALHALLHTDGGLQHFSGRAAAAVAVAVRDQNVVVDILVLVAHPAAHNGIGMQHPVVGGEEIGHRLSYPQSGDQVGQNLRPVDAPPHHGIVGHLVELVPCQLRGHKVINTAFFHDLRQRSRVSEHVRQPKNPVVHAELFFKEALSVHELAHQ